MSASLLPKKEAADLFCGAGGTSAGLLKAARQMNQRVRLLAINHWPTAISTHSLNHRNVRHRCDSLEAIDPREEVPGGFLHLLCASPECTHFSNAAGGRPRNAQSRATARYILKWATDLRVDNILIENVREFMSWGPLDDHGKPIKKYAGKYFKKFLEDLRGLGFNLEHRILCAADYGDPTTRERFFLIARRKKKIVWPDITHISTDEWKRGCGLKKWKPARDIIDWSLRGKSIFKDGRPRLCANTMKRIAAGLRKFGGPNAEPFLVMLRGTSEAHLDSSIRSVQAPAPGLCAGGNHIGLAEPFVLHTTHHGADRIHSPDNPLPTVTGAHRGEMALVEPIIIGQHGGATPRSTKKPLPTVAGKGAISLTEPVVNPIEPFILPREGFFRGNAARSLDQPMQTITGSHNTGYLIEPKLTSPVHHPSYPDPIVVQTDQTGGNGIYARSVDDPLYTVVSQQNMALVEPFIVQYYGTGHADSVDEPLATVTTKDRFLLVEPRTGRAVAELDILFRMLQPHELAAAMSFPRGYAFTGTKEEQVKQIGNAVPVELAAALCRVLLN